MALSTGTRLGPYAILAPLGEGGMGEVYRARDTNLNRDVAVKVLPDVFARDPDRLARFQREAEMLAVLNHPNIAQIYDLEESSGVRALVMELVEGPTLADRIAGGALPPNDAIAIASQIADALEAAHERGIVHRDLKPANIKITPAGVVKVLDFGLARVFTGDDSAPDLSRSPTITVEGTRAGVILGTAAYMSPEQARGKPLDKRTDIWSFGCVLYEMLAGRVAFAGETLTDILAAIVNREPDWGALPVATPRGVRRLLRRCLEKDPRQRLRDIGDARIDLTRGDDIDIGTMRGMSARTTSRRTIAALVAASIAVIAASAAIGLWLRPRPSSDARPTAVHFSLPPPQTGFVGDVERTYLAWSPDGSQLAVIAWDGPTTRRIWLRSISAIDPRPLSGTEEASSLFWSPDGRSIAFFAGSKLKRLDLPNGAAVPVCDVPEGIGLTGTWGAGGEILFASVEGDAIYSVPIGGGTPAALIKADRSLNESRIHWPWFLPDGRRFLYLTRFRDGTGQVTIAERGRASRKILPAVSNVQWVDPDYLVFAREGILVGQRFDLATERVVGEPFSIAEPVDYNFSTGRAMFATSRHGNIAYQSHKNISRLVWSDRNGTLIGEVGTPGNYQSLRFSPDGATLLFDRTAPGVGTYDLWTMDLGRGTEQRLTSDPTSESNAVWLPGGRAVIFMADRGGPPHLFRKNLVTGAEEELLPAGRLQEPLDISPDGKMLVFNERAVRGNNDVLTLSLTSSGAPSVLLGSRFDELGLRFSPDGRAVAFVSDESGRYEVYVAPFPAMVPKIRVSTGGAFLAQWDSAGRELIYRTFDRRVMSVPVRTDPSLEPGTPATLFTLPARWSNFAVAPDGKRFLFIVSDVRSNDQPLSVLLNWPAEVNR